MAASRGARPRRGMALLCASLLASAVRAEPVKSAGALPALPALPKDAPVRTELAAPSSALNPSYAPLLRRRFEPRAAVGVPLICAGAVLGVGAGVLALLGKQSWDEFNAYPRDPPVPGSTQLADLHRIRQRAQIEMASAWVLGTLGVLGLGSGIWILMTGKPDEPAGSGVAVGVEPRVGALAVQGRFP